MIETAHLQKSMFGKWVIYSHVYTDRYIHHMFNGQLAAAVHKYNYYNVFLYSSPVGPLNPNVYDVFPVVLTNSGWTVWTPYGYTETWVKPFVVLFPYS